MDEKLKQFLALTTLLVRNYDEGISFFVDSLGFDLVEDTYLPEEDKRWVVVAPQGAVESRLLLACAEEGEQQVCIGNQTGGRVFLFLHTDDFWRDYATFNSRGVRFVGPPREEAYGTVAVFEDVSGNLWDLLEPK